MEISDAHNLDHCADLLFLASAIRRELGAGIVFSGAACRAGNGLSGVVFNCGSGGGLLADAFGATKLDREATGDFSRTVTALKGRGFSPAELRSAS